MSEENENFEKEILARIEILEEDIESIKNIILMLTKMLGERHE